MAMETQKLYGQSSHFSKFIQSIFSIPRSDIGVIGLAVMGRNLALNLVDNGFCVSVYNRTTQEERLLQGNLFTFSRERVIGNGCCL